MKIKRFSKLKNGMYKIFFEDQAVELHEDLILQYGLLLKKELSDKEIADLERENIQYKAYNIALKELKKKLRSESELCNILKKKEVPETYISKVLLILRKQGYLNDDVYLDSYIHDRILLSSDGPLKIQKDLMGKGFSSSIIINHLSSFTEEMEEERIQKLINKNLKSNRRSLSEFRLRMKQLLIRFGYHNHLISSCLQKVEFDDSASYQREYDKLYRKLSSKYKGQELEYKIRQKLYQKGFKV